MKKPCEKDMMAMAMSRMGWVIGDDVPMANEENRLLLQEINALMSKKEELKEALEDSSDRLDKFKYHGKNAEDNINSNLKLIEAYQQQMLSESHLAKVSHREHAKLKQDLADSVKQYESFKKYLENTEKELCKRQRSVDDRTSRIQWAKTALIEWREAIAEGQKGYELIQKYFKEDEVKARQQDLRRQALNSEIAKYRKELCNLYDTQKSLEQNLERTASLYRIAHAERRQMVDTWKAAVQQMAQREDDIRNAESELIELRLQAKEMTSDKNEHDERLNDIIENNHDVEAAIEELNDETSDIKAQITSLNELIRLKDNEVEILQRELQNLSNRVQQQRMENRQMAKEKTSKIIQVDKISDVIKKLRERLSSMDSKNANAQQRLQILEEIIENEEKNQKQIAKEADRVNDLIFRSQQQLTKFKDEAKLLEVSVKGVQVNIQAIAKNTQLAEKELQRQTEVHYELSFKCLQSERKILKHKGGVIDPDLEKKNQQCLIQLEEYHAALTKRLTATETLNKKMDDSMRTLTACYNNDNKTLEAMQFQIKEAQVYCEGGAKRLKQEINYNQQLIVELSILKMRAKDFEDEIVKCEDQVFSLAQHRAHLDRTIKDRMVEIKSQMALLNLKRKHLCEERSTLRADIGERTTKIEAVRARFELTTKLLGTNEDGTLITATQLRVATAQEKELLTEEGNELNAKVLKAEAEIKAMENTLRVFNCCNDKFRRNFQSVDDTTAANELQNLDTSYCDAICRLRSLRSQLMQLERNMEKLNGEKEMLGKQILEHAQKHEQDTEVLIKLKKELETQEVKLERAERELKKLLKGLRTCGMTPETLALHDLELDIRDMEKRNMEALNQVADIAEHIGDAAPDIIKMMSERNLSLPRFLKRTHSSLSYRSDYSEASVFSARSSRSSGSATCCQMSSSRVSVMSLTFPGPTANNK